MSYLGSWKIDDALTFYVNTTRADTGNATDADAVPSYRVYEDETGTAILTGSMALLDSSNTAGFYSEQITLSAANGFEKGKSYAIYIQATVNNVTGATHHTLQIEAEVDANSVSNIGSGVITAAAIATNAIDADAIADNAIDANSIAASALNGKGDWNIGKTGYALSTAGIQAIWDALTSALTTAGSIGKLLVDNINATISSRATQTSVDTIDNFVDDEVAAIKAVTDKLDDTLEDDGGTYRFTTNALEQAPSGGASAADIADAVWEEAIVDHSGTAGSTAEALDNASSAGDPWSTSLPGSYGAGTAGKIIGDNVNATISSRSSHSASDVWAVGTRTLTSFGTLVADIWANATRTLTAISDSAGVTTLLSRIASALNISSGKVEANIKQINDTTVTGDGSGTPWGPA